MSAWERVKKAFSRGIEKLAESNRKEFGRTAPDCCDRNRARRAGKK